MNRIRTDVFKGLHKRDGAPEGAFLEVSGVTTADYPSMKTRPPRARIGEWENATDVYETDGHLIVIDDNKLYYKASNAEEAVFLSNVSNQKKQFAEIGRKLVIWPDKIYINLNTGEVGSLEASVGGRVSVLDGGVLAVAAEAEKGSLPLKSAYSYDEGRGLGNKWDSTYIMRFYTNLAYSNGWVWEESHNSPRETLPILTNANIGDTMDLSGNSWFFIADKGEPQYFENDGFQKNWSLDGTVYGKLTKMTVTDVRTGTYDEGGYRYDYKVYDATYEYELYDAAAVDLTRFFVAGDTVSVEGNALEYNNREGIKLLDVGKNQLVVENSLVGHANYYNVTTPKVPGTYRLVYQQSQSSGAFGVVFATGRTIRAGEQLFLVRSDASLGGLQATGVYAYDPQTKTLQHFEQASSGPYTDLDATKQEYDAGTGVGMTISRKMPEMDYICERDNRLYGVSNSEEEKIFNTQTGKYETVTSRVLHASALGQPTRWNVFEGAATDSYAVAVAGEGDFTGIVNFSGSVIAFKENRMYKLTGDYPAEFYLRSYTVDGVKEGCHKSLAIINEVLYYLSPYGVMSYSGGVPSLISYEIGIDRYEEAVAGRDRMNYLIQMDKLYCYDTIHGLWVSEDYGKVTGIESVGNSAYIVTDGKIMQTDSGDEKVEWYAVTHFTDEGTFLHKDYQAMNLDAALKDGAEIKMEYRTSEDEPWKTLDTMTSYHGTEWQNRKILNEAKRMHHKFTPGIQRCDRIQFRLSGKGACKIYAYDRVVRFESDKP